MKAKIIKIISFMLICIVLFSCFDSVFRFKYTDGNKPLDIFYEQEKDSIDVLILGSSHAFMEILPEYLWEQHGIASYVLAASVQPTWNTYYYLKEALKTQKPKLILFEGYRLVEGSEFRAPSNAVKSLYSMHFSKNSVDSFSKSFKKENLIDYFFPFGFYHSRYKELGRADFAPYYGEPFYKYYKGGIASLGNDVITPPSQSVLEAKPSSLSKKTESYYRKMMELAMIEGIDFATVIVPYNVPKGEYAKLLAGKIISDEFENKYYNLVPLTNDIGLDYSKHFLKDGHLNIYGAKLVTNYIGDLIKKDFDIPDRRDDAAYDSWNLCLEASNRKYFNNGLKSITNFTEYAKKLVEKGNYTLYISSNKGYAYLKQSEILSALNLLSNDLDELKDGAYIISSGKHKYAKELSDSKNGLDIRIASRDVDFTSFPNEKKTVYATMTGTNNNYDSLYCGMTIVVYDDMLGKVADNIYLVNGSVKITRTNDTIVK